MTVFINSIPVGEEVRFFIMTKKTVSYVEVFEFVQFTGCYYAPYICKKKNIIQSFQKGCLLGTWIRQL